MKVEEIMTVDPVCCTLNETPVQAATLMEQFDVGVIPITESQTSYKLVGIVTDRDIAINVVARGKDPYAVSLSDCMTTQLVCCHPEDEVSEVIAMMRNNQIRRIPVVDDGHCIAGMVSIADLVCSQDVNALMNDISKEENSPHDG